MIKLADISMFESLGQKATHNIHNDFGDIVSDSIGGGIDKTTAGDDLPKQGLFMPCDCCHKRKTPFESFTKMDVADGTLHLCVRCTDLLYKLRDDAKENDETSFEEHARELENRERKMSDVFYRWKREYIKELEQLLKPKTEESGFAGTDIG